MRKASQKRWQLWPILTSAFTITVLAVVLVLQGRAYREGWLGYFGLDSALFPITSTDVSWLALNGWVKTASGWFTGAWDTYWLALKRFWWVLFLFTLGLWSIRLAHHKKHANGGNEQAQDKPSEREAAPEWLTANSAKAWTIRGVLSLILGALSMAVLPAMLFFAGALLITLIGLVVIPFQNAGKEAAAKFCTTPATQVARVILIDGERPASGYRIECNSNYCGVLAGGQVFIVPSSSVRRIELPPRGLAGFQTGSEATVCGAKAPDVALP